MQQNEQDGKELRGIDDELNETNKTNKNVRNVKNKKQSNRFEQALNLPNICNINPRSIYNKKEEFHTLVKEEDLDLIFISESWERAYLPLHEIIQLENYTVVSNVHQRTEIGGRPAIIVNNSKYHIQNLTNSVIQIPWGVEAVWCILTPKNITHDSKIQKNAFVLSIRNLTQIEKPYYWIIFLMLFNVLSTKYTRGLHWRQ